MSSFNGAYVNNLRYTSYLRSYDVFTHYWNLREKTKHTHLKHTKCLFPYFVSV